MAMTALKDVEKFGAYNDLRRAVAINGVSDKRLDKQLKLVEKDRKIDENYRMILLCILHKEKRLESQGKGKGMNNNGKCSVLETRPQRGTDNNIGKCDVLVETRPHRFEFRSKQRGRGDNFLEETRPQRLELRNKRTGKGDDNGEYNVLEETRSESCYKRRGRGRGDDDCYILDNFFQRVKSQCKRKERDEMVDSSTEQEKDPHPQRLIKFSKECDDAKEKKDLHCKRLFKFSKECDDAKEKKDPHSGCFSKDLKAYDKSNVLRSKNDCLCMVLDGTALFNEGTTRPLVHSREICDNEKPGPSNAHNGNEFRRRLLEFLRRPYDQEEYIRHRKAAEFYFRYHPDLEKKLTEYFHKPGKCLTLLRGFFYWLHNVAEEGAFQPWKDCECLAVESPPL